MKVLAGFVCVLIGASSAVARGDDAGSCASPFAVKAEAGMRLAIDSKSAGVDVVGTENREIRVSCTLDDPDRAHEVKIRYRPSGSNGELSISGGPTNNVRIVIEIPHQTHLRFRMPAGAIHVKEVTGDKDVEIHAGELIVTGVNPKEYRSVEASVDIGEVKAPEFSVEKGGFFRSFKRSSGEGLYRLDAHIMTGSIQLN